MTSLKPNEANSRQNECLSKNLERCVFFASASVCDSHEKQTPGSMCSNNYNDTHT